MMEEERKWKVYVHENKINGKRYVGITSQSLSRRWRRNGDGYKERRRDGTNAYFYNAIQKYGWNDGFYHYIIADNLTEKESKQMEIDFIRLWGLTDCTKGYNQTIGGDGCIGIRLSNETKAKLSKLNSMGNNNMAKEVICDGKIFSCAKECAVYYKVSYSAMRSWLNCSGSIPEEYYNLGLRYVNENINTNIGVKDHRKEISCGGIIYESISCFCRNNNLKLETVRSWLNGINKMPDYFINNNLQYVNQQTKVKKHKHTKNTYFIVGGIMYDQINSYCCENNVSKSLISQYLRNKIKMSKKYIDLGLRYATQEEIDQYIASKEVNKVS